MINKKWVKLWESFAGKPYIPHKPAGTIRETVHDAQELMANLNLSDITWSSWEDYDKFYGLAEKQEDKIQYPQSLGELCLEEYEDSDRSIAEHYCVSPVFFNEYHEEMRDLRQLMWHKNRGTV